MPTPPFADAAGFATALRELVPDTKAQRTDADLVSQALERYAERFPSWQSADIGDGSTFEWRLGVASTAAFEDVLIGYSELHGFDVQELDTGDVPYRPQVSLRSGRDFYLDRRTVSGEAALFLVFLDAPSRVRVTWRKRWALLEVPVAHQMAIVYRAAAYKCEALASVYAASVDPTATGTDLFSGDPKVEGYRSQARTFMSNVEGILGVGTPSSGLSVGQVRTGQLRVFPRGMLP